VPADVDLVAMVRRSVEPAPAEPRTARLWVAAGHAHGLRRLGTVRGPAEYRGRSGDEVELELRSVDVLARWIAGHGPDAVVLDPPELADAVRARFAAAVAAHSAAGNSAVATGVTS
jgi:proteasome accessory factor B